MQKTNFLRLSFCLACLVACFITHAQNSAKSLWICGDDEFASLQKRAGFDYAVREKMNNLQIRDYIKQHFQPGKNKLPNKSRTTSIEGGVTTNDDTTYTIPVVVHVIYPAGEVYGTGTNISYAQIRSQIEALNAAFAKSYPLYNGQMHPDYAQNTGIRFCLARTSASSNGSWFTGPVGTEYGVMRYADSTGISNHFINVGSANQLLAVTHPQAGDFPFDKYLNIWLVATIDGGNSVMGYAPRPIMGNYPLDGIVMRSDIFGDNTTGGHYSLAYNLTQGKILAHEIGHYFNLYHIFQDGCAGANAAGSVTDACDLNGDRICDIEPCTTQNVLCDSGPYNTCTANYQTGTTQNDMINDYMSYADDDCMNTFTQNQAQRMWATLQISRKNLWQPANLTATGVLGLDGCVPPYLNASVTINNNFICAGSSIFFSNASEGNTATSRQWRFSGGDPSISISDTVTVTFASPGNYKAFLTVSDGADSRTDSVSFSVVTCHLDSSLATMAHWYFGDYCSLDFSSGMPVKTTTAFDHNTMHAELAYQEQIGGGINSTVSVSDSSGNLLFYCNGVSVWNGDHKKISTSSIFGKSDINSTTGLFYVPYPDQPNKYFIVGVYPDYDEKPSSVRFVVVDVTNNTVSQYQELHHPSLPKRFSEHITVIPHCNGTDYWIITKGYGLDNDNNFYSFLVTANGIDASQAPVISTGFTEPGYGGDGYQLVANRNGDKLLLSSSHYPNNIAGALYDFDSHTGIISNERLVPEVSGYNDVQSGGAFSPNGEFFYLMRSTDALNGPPYWLFQYRVRDFAYNIIPTTGFYFAYPFQLGPDNQLYIANGYNYLARVSDPDTWGGATFNGEFIAFDEPTFRMREYNCLPNFINAKRKEPLHPDFTIQPVNCTAYTFSTLCFDNYISTWDFGDGSPKQTGSTINHTFTGNGIFNVKLTLSNAAKTFGSAVKQVTVAPDSISITGPDSICNTNKYAAQYYTAIIPDANYKWSVTNGLISGLDNLSSAGINWQNNKGVPAVISVHVSVGNYCSLDAKKTISVTAGPVFEWSLPDSVCITDSALTLTARPAGGIFSGDGIQEAHFIPRAAGTGDHELIYRYGEGSVCFSEIQKNISVVKGKISGTVFTWPLPGSICITDSLLLLTASPAGGRFSGTGVDNNYFFTYQAGLGNYDLTYRIGEDTGCYSEIQKMITVIQQCENPKGNGIPTGFTPNHDGRNDVFRIPAGIIKELSSFSVYNRWGELLFATQNITKGWDGNVKGIPADNGTYIYRISGKKDNGKLVTLTGTITLIR